MYGSKRLPRTYGMGKVKNMLTKNRWVEGGTPFGAWCCHELSMVLPFEKQKRIPTQVGEALPPVRELNLSISDRTDEWVWGFAVSWPIMLDWKCLTGSISGDWRYLLIVEHQIPATKWTLHWDGFTSSRSFMVQIAIAAILSLHLTTLQRGFLVAELGFEVKVGDMGFARPQSDYDAMTQETRRERAVEGGCRSLFSFSYGKNHETNHEKNIFLRK